MTTPTSRSTVPAPPLAAQPDPDRDALEREIEHTREELVHTVDAIVDRVAPAKVAHRTTEQAKRNGRRAVDQAQVQAKDAVQQIRTYAEDEPQIALAVGAGVGGLLLWLLWQSVRPIKRPTRSYDLPVDTRQLARDVRDAAGTR